VTRLAAVALAACCALGASWSSVWTLGTLVDLPSALDRLAPELPDLHPPAWAERWLYNPRERTAAGVDALQDGRREDGVEALDTALRQAPDDPVALYNAGSGRLFAEEHPDRAAAQLERATTLIEQDTGAVPPDLAPFAYYNLGNARLAAGDAAGAAEAYRQSLRLQPSLRPAKRNLELALARMTRKKPRALPPRETPGGDRPGEKERSESSGGEEPNTQREEGAGARQPDAGQRQQAEGRGQGQAPESGTPEATGAGAVDPRLLRFDEQADMSAAEAAALLDAIDSLERAERRQEALARATAAERSGEEDW